MARKPYRHKSLTPEVLAALFAEISPPKMLDEVLAFYEAAVGGLTDLLERKDPNLAEATRKAYEYTYDRFGALVRRAKWARRSDRLEFAKLTTRYFIAGARSRDPDPIELLMQLPELVDEVSSIESNEDRRRWLRKHGVSEKDLNKVNFWSVAEVAERGLAATRGMSYSRVHKVLSEAQKHIQTLLGKPPTKKAR